MAARTTDTARFPDSAPAPAPAPDTGPTLEIRRTIRAARQRVFDAWTTPDEMKKWSAPGPMVNSLAEVDLRVGGTYRIRMRGPDGAEHQAAGVYREVDPPKKLVYTWQWESEADADVTLVTVEFIELGERTEVVLRHAGFSTETKRDSHENGWLGCMTKFESLF